VSYHRCETKVQQKETFYFYSYEGLTEFATYEGQVVPGTTAKLFTFDPFQRKVRGFVMLCVID